MKVYIETERLIIRDPIIDDFEAVWAMRNDEDVTTFTGGVTKRTKEQVYERHVKECANHSSEPREYAVVLKDSGDYIGYCGFQYCSVLKDIEILYGYAKDHWGKGYALEAAKAVMAFGLNELKLDKIVAAVNYDNVASDQILIKIGMTYQGDIEWPDQGMVKSYVKYRIVPLVSSSS